MKFHYQAPRPKKSHLKQVLAAGYIPIRHEVARLLIRAIDPNAQLTSDLDVVSPERFTQIVDETRAACPAPTNPAAWMVELSEAVAREFQQAASLAGNHQ